MNSFKLLYMIPNALAQLERAFNILGFSSFHMLVLPIVQSETDNVSVHGFQKFFARFDLHTFIF